jgi:HEAT repeat protein
MLPISQARSRDHSAIPGCGAAGAGAGVGQDGGRVSGSPEELLRSALEKVIFFECRVASLEHELVAARATAARARDEAGAARRRESELESKLAELKGAQAVGAVHNDELSERVRLLEAERERFLSGMVESARVAGAPAGDDDDAGNSSELAGFIAELRAEIEVLTAWKREAEAAGYRPAVVPTATPTPTATATAPSAAPATAAAAGTAASSAGDDLPPPARAGRGPVSVPAMATAFEQSGRITVSAAEARALPSFATRSERALYESCLDDLAARDPAVRRRAADGLRALGSRGAAPLVAAALGREADADVKTALLAALGALAEANASDLALRELADPRPPVRAAALDAVSALAGPAAIPALTGSLVDASPLVRRRAVVLLGFARGETADEALAGALTDRDAGVARAAAAALAGRPSARAQGALARALEHRDAAVRRAAALATARWSGEAVDTSAPEAERRRAARRISEKLLEVGGEALRSAVTKVRVVAAPPPHAARTRPRVTSPSPFQGEGRGEGASRGSAAAAMKSAVAVAAPDAALAEAALTEVQAALRGRTADELSAALGSERLAVESTLRALVAQGRLVARGPRFFMS